MFVDKVKIRIKGGIGGSGCSSFRRERFLPKGGPDGGDGGEGGNVIIQANPNQQDLTPLKFMNHFEAENGLPGSGNRKHGRRGKDILIQVPIGTVIKDVGNCYKLVADLCTSDSSVVAAHGGKGGKGNVRYVSSVNRFPRKCQPGQDGEEFNLELELKMIADIGLVGYPNAGKSTYLNGVSNANPKVADYPFTTLTPHVGVVEFEDLFRMTIADIPGIIDGAHQNVGLGFEFLRHIERSKVLAFVLDMGYSTDGYPWKELTSLKRELDYYRPGLTKRPSIILANKMDKNSADENLKNLRRKTDLEICPISATQKINIEDSLDRLRCLVSQQTPEWDRDPTD